MISSNEKASRVAGITSSSSGPMRMRASIEFLALVLWISVAVYLVSILQDVELFRHATIRNFLSPRIKSHFGAPSVMEDLGFVYRPRLYPQSYHSSFGGLPIFVAAASSDEFDSLMVFIKTQRIYFLEKKLVIYNLDLTTLQIKELSLLCRCLIRDFVWHRYPRHIRAKHTGAYRPLIIQEALMEFGAIFWCEPRIRFNSAELYLLLSQAERVGVVAWPMSYPTSSFTHENTFRYLEAKQSDYRFHRMVETDGLVLYNTETVHKELMKPWVKCALDEACIDPLGAQPHGCDLELEPKYRYTGCHRYDTAAFNVILGQMFKFDQPYLPLLDIFEVAEF